MNELFCTPEQGKRLKELAPNIKSYFVYTFIPTEGYDEPRMVFVRGGGYRSYPEVDTYDYPALTLQELRDVANQYPAISCKTSFYTAMSHMAAPELAAWVIERLEALP